jgi:hypothetical protein
VIAGSGGFDVGDNGRSTGPGRRAEPDHDHNPRWARATTSRRATATHRGGRHRADVIVGAART